MYLSKLEIDMSNPSARQALLDCQDMHRNLMRAFDTTRREAGVLYRIEKSRRAITLYVLSACEPAWAALAGQGYRCCGVKEISALRQLYQEGAVLSFSLRACPAKKVCQGGKNSRREFLRSEGERKVWMEHQAEKYGFEVIALREDSGQKWIDGNKGDSRIRYGAIDFTGILRIRNANQFWHSYGSGFGAGKAYGMGLMLLKRA